MKLKLLIFVMALAAMGPARDAPPPDGDAVPRVNPARLPPVNQTPLADRDPAPVAAEVRILSALDTDPADFLWQARPVVVFGDTPDDPAFVRQIEVLRSDSRALASRDVVVITDADPQANSPWRRQLRPRGFSLLIIDKDGQVKIRRPSLWDAREIGRAIDRLPLRRQEIGRGNGLR